MRQLSGAGFDAISREKFLNTLADSYVLQDAILDNIELLIISTTKDGIVNSYNRAAEKMLGFPAEDILGRESLLAFHDLNEVLQRADQLTHEFGHTIAPGFEAIICKARATRTAERREWTYVRQDGTRFPVELSVSVIYNDRDEITGYLTIASDISEQKKTEGALHESEQKFRILAENIPGTIYLCRNDSAYSMVYLNESVVALTGYTREEFLKGEINFVKLYHPDDQAHIFKEVDEAVAKRKSFHIKYRIRHKNGTWRWLEEFGIGVYLNDELSLLEGYLIDITDQKLVDERLAESQAEIQAILSSLDDLVMEIDEHGNYRNVWAKNPESLFFSVESHLTKNVRDLLPAPLEGQFLESVRTALNEQRSVAIEYPSIFPQDDRWFSARFTPIKHIAVKPPSVSVLIEDITSRKRTEQEQLLSKSNLEAATLELQEQNNQLNEFAHIISHNLRSPVANISALIGLLNQQSSIEDYHLIFEKLKNTAGNLQGTLNDLMETLHIKKGAMAQRTQLSFYDVLTKVRQDLAGEIIQSKANLTHDFLSCPNIVYSKTYLESIFLNLLSNALKYKAPGRTPTIHFATSQQGPHIILTVSDNGLGIDLQQYGDKVFGLRKTFHAHKDARGVGLFLTRTQVEAMGGKISVNSTVNQGSTFIIQF